MHVLALSSSLFPSSRRLPWLAAVALHSCWSCAPRGSRPKAEHGSKRHFEAFSQKIIMTRLSLDKSDVMNQILGQLHP